MDMDWFWIWTATPTAWIDDFTIMETIRSNESAHVGRSIREDALRLPQKVSTAGLRTDQGADWRSTRNQSVTTSQLSRTPKLVIGRWLRWPTPVWSPLVEEEGPFTSLRYKLKHCFLEQFFFLLLTVGRWLLVNGRVMALSAQKGAGFDGTSILLTSRNFSLNGNTSIVLVLRDSLNFLFKKFEKNYARSGVRTEDLLICNPPLSPIRYRRLVDQLGTDAYENECVFAYSFLNSLFLMIPNLFLYFRGHFFEPSVVSPSSWPK